MTTRISMLEKKAGVYIISGEAGRVKIGVTKNLQSRMRAIQTSTSARVELLRFIDNAQRKTERWMHREFDKLRLQGEWFRFDEKMLTIVVPNEADMVFGKKNYCATGNGRTRFVQIRVTDDEYEDINYAAYLLGHTSVSSYLRASAEETIRTQSEPLLDHSSQFRHVRHEP